MFLRHSWLAEPVDGTSAPLLSELLQDSATRVCTANCSLYTDALSRDGGWHFCNHHSALPESFWWNSGEIG